MDTNTTKSENHIKISKRINFLESAISEIYEEHKNFIKYCTELREIWNTQLNTLHTVKDTLVKNREILPVDFFKTVNDAFNNWYNTPGGNGLAGTYLFVLKVEEVSKKEYSANPDIKEISDLLFAVQNIKITYQMFDVYRNEWVGKVNYYHKGITDFASQLQSLIEELRNQPVISWQNIESY